MAFMVSTIDLAFKRQNKNHIWCCSRVALPGKTSTRKREAIRATGDGSFCE